MITKLIRKALGPTLDNRFIGESIRLNAIINEMENAVDDVKSIRASDIANEIDVSTIGDTIDPYDIARNIEIDASDIEIDYAELSRHIVGNMDNTIEEADLEVLAHKVVKHITANTDYRLWKIERKMDLILNHLGIGAEDLLVYANFEKFHSNEENT